MDGITRTMERRMMTIAEELKLLKQAQAELEEKYCENCQEWDCDFCKYEPEPWRGDNDEID